VVSHRVIEVVGAADIKKEEEEEDLEQPNNTNEYNIYIYKNIEHLRD
jgi:hypothetical protein